MGRVFDELRVNGHRFLTLFDSGAVNNYITESAGKTLQSFRLHQPFLARIGGHNQRIRKACTVEGTIAGKPVLLQAMVIKSLGADRKTRRSIDLLFGAQAMQQWGIELDLKHEKLDLSRYSREFTEYTSA